MSFSRIMMNLLPSYHINEVTQVAVKFNSDGTYTETSQAGGTLSGTWKFLNGETQTEVKNTSGTYTATIINLAENNFIWQDLTRSGGILAKMINQ